jgi:hypothetical protein
MRYPHAILVLCFDSVAFAIGRICESWWLLLLFLFRWVPGALSDSSDAFLGDFLSCMCVPIEQS